MCIVCCIRVSHSWTCMGFTCRNGLWYKHILRSHRQVLLFLNLWETRGICVPLFSRLLSQRCHVGNEHVEKREESSSNRSSLHSGWSHTYLFKERQSLSLEIA